MTRAFAVIHILRGEVALIRVENNSEQVIECPRNDQESIQTVINQIGPLDVQFIIANQVTRQGNNLVRALGGHSVKILGANILLFDLINIVRESHRYQPSYRLEKMIDFVLHNKETRIETASEKAWAYLAIFREANATIGKKYGINYPEEDFDITIGRIKDLENIIFKAGINYLHDCNPN